MAEANNDNNNNIETVIPIPVISDETYMRETREDHTCWMDDQIQFRLNAIDCKTGFDNLDAQLAKLYPGLYAIGAVPSLGKTTFMTQLADSIAAAGYDVMHFSLEQSRFELVSKSVARIAAIQQWNTKGSFDGAPTASKIREIESMADNDVNAAERVYTQHVAPNKITVYCGYNVNAESIIAAIERGHKTFAQRSQLEESKYPYPVVIIDYLQVLNAPQQSYGIRDAVDANLQKLRDFQSRNKIILWLISSFNRASYNKPVSMESFKESGGIEFTADFIAGLQLDEVNNADGIGNKPSDQIKFARELNAAKAAPFRKVNLVCLKNRQGAPSFVCNYFYIPKHDLFVSLTDEQAKSARFKSTEDKGLSTEIQRYAKIAKSDWNKVCKTVSIHLPKRQKRQ